MVKRITITISPDSKEWLQEHKEFLNVSALCQSAIFFATTRQEYQNARDFMSRLALEKLGEPYSRGFEDAFGDVFENSVLTYTYFRAIEKGVYPNRLLEGRLTDRDGWDWWNHYYQLGWQTGLKLIWNKFLKTEI